MKVKSFDHNSEGHVTGVLLFHYFKSNFDFPESCDLTLESINSHQQFLIELKTANHHTLAELPADRYVFSSLRCTSVRQFDEIYEVMKEIVEVRDGKISLIADCTFSMEVTHRSRELLVIFSDAVTIMNHLRELSREVSPAIKNAIAPGYRPREIHIDNVKPASDGKRKKSELQT